MLDPGPITDPDTVRCATEYALSSGLCPACRVNGSEERLDLDTDADRARCLTCGLAIEMAFTETSKTVNVDLGGVEYITQPWVPVLSHDPFLLQPVTLNGYSDGLVAQRCAAVFTVEESNAEPPPNLVRFSFAGEPVRDATGATVYGLLQVPSDVPDGTFAAPGNWQVSLVRAADVDWRGEPTSNRYELVPLRDARGSLMVDRMQVPLRRTPSTVLRTHEGNRVTVPVGAPNPAKRIPDWVRNDSAGLTRRGIVQNDRKVDEQGRPFTADPARHSADELSLGAGPGRWGDHDGAHPCGRSLGGIQDRLALPVGGLELERKRRHELVLADALAPSLRAIARPSDLLPRQRDRGPRGRVHPRQRPRALMPTRHSFATWLQMLSDSLVDIDGPPDDSPLTLVEFIGYVARHLDPGSKRRFHRGKQHARFDHSVLDVVRILHESAVSRTTDALHPDHEAHLIAWLTWRVTLQGDGGGWVDDPQSTFDVIVRDLAKAVLMDVELIQNGTEAPL